MRANRWRVYVNPLDYLGRFYTGFVEVTDDVELDSMGTVDQQLDNTDYNIGIYRNSTLQLTFRNDSGRYSDVGGPNSIFQYTRSNSLVKLTYTGADQPLIAGFMQSNGPDMIVAPEITIFTGLLSDKNVTIDLSNQELQFDVLGLENILSSVPVQLSSISSNYNLVESISAGSPGVVAVFASVGPVALGIPLQFTTTGVMPKELTAGQTYYLSGVVGDLFHFTLASSQPSALTGSAINTTTAATGNISAYLMSDLFVSDIIKAMLNQAAITKVLNFDATRINPGNDMLLQDTSEFSTLSVWDALSELLLISNSVLYVDQTTQTVVVSPRTVAPALAYTFYGQSSVFGVENIQDIQNIQAGLSRVFNSFVWTPSNITVQYLTSIAKFGLVQKTFKYIVYTDTVSQANIMTPLLNEFSQPKQEMDIYAPISYATLALFLLNKVAIDYPPVCLPGPDPFPICGQAVCGQGVLPTATWGFTEIPTNFYKIEGTSIDPQTDLICFSVRRV